MAISAFKHIRLSGHNLTPLQGQPIYGGGSTLRLGFGNSGLAYYSELTGISGFLQSQIASAGADVSSIFIPTGNGLGVTLQDAINLVGTGGTQILVNGQTITISGNSGYFQSQVDQLSTRLNQSGSAYFNTFATQTNLTATQTNLALTGSRLATYNINYSGWANAEFVRRSTQQVFRSQLTPIDRDEYAIIYPVPFASTPRVTATLEIPGDIMYNLNIKSIGLNGYSGVLSDNVLESPAFIHTFASSQ